MCLKSQFFVFVYSFSFEKNWLILVFLVSSSQVQLSKKTLLRYKVTYAQLKKYSHDKNSAIKKVGELAEKKEEYFSLKSYILCKMLLAQLNKKRGV